MAKTSFEFFNEQVPSFRKKVQPYFIHFTNLLNGYRDHVLTITEGEVKTAEDFLAEDNLLKLELENAKCYEDAIHVMESFAKEL